MRVWGWLIVWFVVATVTLVAISLDASGWVVLVLLLAMIACAIPFFREVSRLRRSNRMQTDDSANEHVTGDQEGVVEPTKRSSVGATNQVEPVKRWQLIAAIIVLVVSFVLPLFIDLGWLYSVTGIFSAGAFGVIILWFVRRPKKEGRVAGNKS